MGHQGKHEAVALMPVAPALLAGLVLLALSLAARPQPVLADIAQGEDVALKNLAWHDGMIIFNGALRKTIPPNATAATPGAAVPCACSDVAPRDTSSGTPPFLATIDCFFHRQYGDCNASFMQGFLTELVFNQGFCQISCGRCTCCSNAVTVLQKMTGATRFLQALQVARPSLLDLLSHPGWAGTLLVPTDAAWDAALATQPGMLRDPAALQQVLKLHMLPPEPRTRGLWTTPFMAVGAKLWTSADTAAPLQTSRLALPPGTTADGGLTGIRITGPVNSATVVGPSDLLACKAYITAIDTVLLPFDPAALAAGAAAAAAAANAAGNASASASSGLGAALGAPQCILQANAGLNATTVVAGADNRQHSVGDCCASCQKTAGCNAFVFCSPKGGCRLGDGTQVPFGSCQLVHAAEVVAGQPAAWVGWSATLPLISGYIPAASPAAIPPAAAAAAAP